MAANGHEQTVSEYIVHHLTNLTYGKLPAGFVRDDGTVVADAGLWKRLTVEMRSPLWGSTPSMLTQ